MICADEGLDARHEIGGDAATPMLTLYQAKGFWSRLRGLHARRSLPWGTGLHLSPCRAIHTFGLAYAIDVVFLDADLQELKRVDAVGPNEVFFCWKAVSVVELPVGYCAAHARYLEEIRRALGW